MAMLKIKPGNHASFPPQVSFGRTPVKWTWRIDLLTYSATGNGDDDWDWSKLCGITVGLLDSMENSVMVGIRENPLTGLIELNAYYHPGKGRYFTEPLVTVEKGSTIICSCEITDTDFIVCINNIQHMHPHGMGEKRRCCREVSWWYGGNKKATTQSRIRKKKI